MLSYAINRVLALVRSPIGFILILAGILYYGGFLAFDFYGVGRDTCTFGSVALGETAWQYRTCTNSGVPALPASNPVSASVSTSGIEGQDGSRSIILRTPLASSWQSYELDAVGTAKYTTDSTRNCNGAAGFDIGGYSTNSGCSNVLQGEQSLAGTVRVIKTSTGRADVYVKECDTCEFIYKKTIDPEEDFIYASVSANTNEDNDPGSSGRASVRMNALRITGPINLAVPDNIPSSAGLIDILKKLSNWFSRLWNLVPLSIVGATEYTLPDASVPSLASQAEVSYDVSLEAAAPIDATISDGTYQVRYCTAGMVSKDGSIHSSTTPERCENVWSKQFDTTIPTKVGDYVVVAIMTQYDGVYDDGAWRWGQEKIIAQEALNVKTKAPIPGSESLPQPGFLAKFANGIINFFKQLFGV